MRILIVLLTLFASISTRAETWFQINDDSYMLECPDVIVFKSGTYEILNDCYGATVKHPVIEVGKYKIENGFITFVKRKIYQPSFIRGEAKTQKMELHKNNDTIKLIDGTNVYYFKIAEDK